MNKQLLNQACLVILILVLGMVACKPHIPEAVALAYEELPEEVDFNQHVKPILSDKCFACHGPDENKLKVGLRLDIESIAKGDLPENKGKKAIVGGSLRKSQLIHRTFSTNPDFKMPPPESNHQLSPVELAILAKWIENGANYKPHWAFIKPSFDKIPDVSDSQTLVINPIDNFVLEKLLENDLDFSPGADKVTLLRRLSLDLIGLPPSLEEIEQFLSDDSPNAYEKQVDRLLASPHYGEKMAMDWMDVARYADTHGYQSDRFRDVSGWRDWVINSFNRNMPYDDFITWQLAGDLLPNPSKDQKIATAFLRLHPQNEEGGIVEEEFRVEYVADRTNTVGTAFMAMTVGCARCHSHKFDPVSHKNYYELFSFFNNVNEAGQISFDGAMPVPTMILSDERQDSILAFMKQKIDEQHVEMDLLDKSPNSDFEEWLASETYKKEVEKEFPPDLVAHFPLDNFSLRNRLNANEVGRMNRTNSSSEEPQFTTGNNGGGLLLDGDAWLDLHPAGQFERNQSFSVGLRVKLPENLRDGVIFHKGVGAALYNFKGYHLAIKDDQLEILMAATAPYNAIVERTISTVPRDEWIHLCLTYDGSSEAEGLKLFLNGKELETEILHDHLYKNISVRTGGNSFAGLQVGARWRGKGIGGASVDDIQVYGRNLTDLEVKQLGDPTAWKQLVFKDISHLSAKDKIQLKAFYLSRYSPNYDQKKVELMRARKSLNDSIQAIPELMVMDEMEISRPSYILDRGQYDARLEEVLPNTPVSILPMSEALPKNRLGLARWLTDPDHPLTARVAVNRYWQVFFAKGLVRTTEDFGNQGELPSHPDLLDWLALYFVDSGWDVKGLQKLIVMSTTYRQTSKVSDELRSQDPSNILLARGPSGRLSAEMIRDNVLAASGVLNRKIGGPSVYPYQPEGLWEVNGNVYTPSLGVDLYRRSLYTIWKRSVPHPTQASFDAPDRSECTTRRQETNTPLQALVLMNDPAFVEAARNMGQAITKSGDITSVFRKLTGRHPLDEELNLLEELYNIEYKKFKEKKARAKGWLTTGASSPDNRLEPEKVAANAVVASAITNADATIFKR